MTLRKISPRRPSKARSRSKARPPTAGGAPGGRPSAFYAAGPAVGLAAPVQTKVKIGRRGDAYEREADGVAERVARSAPVPAVSRLPPGGLGHAAQRTESGDEDVQKAEDEDVQEQSEEEGVQEKCADCEKEDVQEKVEDENVQKMSGDEEVQEQSEEEDVQAQSEDENVQKKSEDEDVQAQSEDENVQEMSEDENVQEASESEEDVQEKRAAPGRSKHAAAGHAIRGAGVGEALHRETRERLESSFGVGLGDVRVHHDTPAKDAARKLKARAFTHKNHIWLGSGESQADLRLMAHETTHVLQQDAVVRRKPLPSAEEKGGAPPPASRAPEAPAPAATPEAPATAGAKAPAEPRPAEPVAKTGPGEPPAKGKATAPAGAPEGGTDGAPAEGGEAGSDAGGKQRLGSVLGKLKKTSQAQQGDAASPAKAAGASRRDASQASAAAPSPANEAMAQGQASQVETMDAQEAGKVDQKSFLDLVKEKLREMDVPDNPEQMDKFKSRGGASGLKSQISGGVAKQKEVAAGDIRGASAAEPQPAEPRQPQDLPPQPDAPPPGQIAAEKVLPPPKSDAEISLDADRDEMEATLEREKLTEERLEKANDPRFSAAQASREEVRAHADAAPRQYREAEAAYLTEQHGAARGDARQGTAAMRASRQANDALRRGRQTRQMSAEEASRKTIADDLQKIYAATKKKVDDKLLWLDGEVDRLFTEGEAKANQEFGSYVDDEMGAWKDKRYSGLSGAWTWVEDRFRDINELPAVKKIFADGQEVYFGRLDTTIDAIDREVDTALAWCKSEIKAGREEVKTYLKNLDDDLKKLGAEAAKDVLGQFDDLKGQVEEKRNALADHLVERYQQSRQKLAARIEKMKDANRSLYVKAKRKIEAVIEAIDNFRKKLMSVLSRAGEVIELILEDPIGFLSNLLAAVKKGFQQFSANIWTHLKKGLFGWLFGALASTGIQIPSEFSPKAIVGLILQILGVTYDKLRKKAVRLIGERNVAVIEKVAGYLQTLFTEGPAGLWKEIKEDLGNLKDFVIEAIKDWVVTKIVTAAVTKLVSMFNPVGAIVQAVLTIYNVVMFFIERIDQILQLVTTVVDSLSRIVRGQIESAASAVERAMGLAVPVIISFLARLLGLGGIAGRIQRIVKKVQRRVDKAIDKAIRKIAARFKKGRKKPPKAETGRSMTVNFKMKGKAHKLKVVFKNKRPIIYMASGKLNQLTKRIQDAKSKTQDKKIINTLSGYEGEAKKLEDEKEEFVKSRGKTVFMNSVSGLSERLEKYGYEQGLEDLLPPQDLEDEGRVGTYASLKGLEDIEADHEPQNKLLEEVSQLQVALTDGTAGSLFPGSTGIGQYRKKDGITMAMQVTRHTKTRTHTNRSLYKEALTRMGADKGVITVPGATTLDDARAIASQKVKDEVSYELAEDRKVVAEIYNDPKWKLSDQVKDRAINVANTNVETQNREKWSEVFK